MSPLVDFVETTAVDARLGFARKARLLRHFAERLAAAFPGVEPSELVDAFRSREREQSTAVGRGVALPHAILAGADRSIVGVFTTAAPVHFQAPDREPVDVFFAIVGPASDRETHLRLLSTIARLSLKTDLLERLRAADTRAQMLEALNASAEISQRPQEAG